MREWQPWGKAKGQHLEATAARANACGAKGHKVEGIPSKVGLKRMPISLLGAFLIIFSIRGIPLV
jgi:hypothetical protein